VELERRVLLAVSATTLAGPLTPGDQWAYQFVDVGTGNITSTLTSTIIGPATFNGHVAVETDTTLTLSATSSVTNGKSYGALTPTEGSVGFGGTATMTNSGMLVDTSMNTDTPEALQFPMSMNPGQVYTSNYTVNSVVTLAGGSPTTTTRTVSAQIVLSSATPVSVSVPAGVFSAFLINIMQVNTPQGQSPQTSTIQEWTSPTVGIVKIATTTGSNEIDQELTSFTPVGGLGGTITAAISKDTLPSTVVPGDRGLVTLKLTNPGSTLERGTIDLSAAFTPDGVPADGVTVALPRVFSNLPLLLPAGGTRLIGIPVTVPATLTTGTEEVAVTVSPVSGFASNAFDTTPAVSPTTHAVTLSFGTVGGRRVLLQEDVGSSSVTRFLISGPGTGTLVPATGGGLAVDLAGTTAASNVIILGPASGVTLGGITDASPFGAIIGLHTNVNGNLTLTGGGRLVRMANLGFSKTFLDGSASIELVLGNVTDSSFESNEPFSAVVMGSWINTTPQSFTAPSVRLFLDKGDLTGGTLATTGDVGTALILGNLAGNVFAGANLGTDQQPGGGDDTFAVGHIGALHVKGSVLRSIVAAGLSPADDTFPLTGNDSLLPGGSIVTAFIGGALSTDSQILAATLPRVALINNRLVHPFGDPRFRLP
jgi:hypothetical protein